MNIHSVGKAVVGTLLLQQVEAFGYAMNHVIPRWQSTRNRSLVDALYACL